MIAPLLSLTRWLQSRAIALEPEQTGIAEGLRSATAVASLVLLSQMVQMPLLTWAAFSAFWTCLADPGGFARNRLRIMGLFAAAGTLMAGLAAWVGTLPAVPATLCLTLLVFLCSLLPLKDAALAQVGVLASVVAVVAVDYPGPPPHAAALSAIFLGGTLWALLICLVLWRTHPHQPARRAITAIYRDLGAMCADLAARHKADADGAVGPPLDEATHRRAVRGNIERARGMLDRLAINRQAGRAQQDLEAAVEAGDRLLAGLIALEHHLHSDPAAAQRRLFGQFLKDLSWALSEAGTQLLTLTPVPTGIEAAATLLAAHGRDAAPFDAHMAALFADTFRTLSQRWEQAGAAPPPASGKAAPGGVHPAPVWRHAARLAVTVGAVRLVTTHFGLPYAYWATMAVLVVMQPHAAVTWPRMVERSLGSIVGGLAAALLAWLVPTPHFMLLVIFPLAAATIAFRAVNYTLFVACLTTLFVLVIDLGAFGHGDAIAASRIVNNVLGSLFGLLGCLLLWPDPPPAPFTNQVAQAIKSNIAYAVTVLGGGATPDTTDAARKQAGIGSSTAEVALQRMILEGRARPDRRRAAAALLAALRRLAGVTTAVWLGEDGGRHAEAGAARAVGDALIVTLLVGAPEPPPLPPALAATPIGQAIAQVIESGMAYAAALGAKG